MWMPDYTTTQGGSFSAPELLTNNDFSNGTTGWTGANASLSVSDRVLRLTNTKASGAASFNVSRSGVSVTQYAAYVLRSHISAVSRGGLLNGIRFDTENYATDRAGMVIQSDVQIGTTTGTVYPGVFDAVGTGSIAGDFGEISYTSLTRCPLVDGGKNALLRSDTPSHASWSKSNATASAVLGVAPDGEADAEALIEDGANSQHLMTQAASRSSVAEDLIAYGYFKRRTGTRNVQIQIDDGSGNGAYVVFNLGAGTAGSPVLAGTGTAARAFIASAGDGWYYCAIISRCAASTSIRAIFLLHNTSSDFYTGDSSSSIYAWRCGAARSGLPTRGSQTVATALASGSTQASNSIYVHGLPASNSGLLYGGDMVQIDGQINRVISELKSDAAGTGKLICANPWRGAISGAPIIVNTPMCKMMLADDSVDIETLAGRMSPFQIELIEAIE